MAHTNTCSAATLAKLFGTSERWVQQLAQEGIVVRSPQRGHYELIGSVRGYIGHLQAKLSQRLEQEEPSLQAARKRLLQLQADKTECELGILRRNYVPEVEIETFVEQLVQCFIHG